MNYRDQWSALSARIRSLMRTAQLHADFLEIRKSDSQGRTKRLHEQCLSVLIAIEDFHSSFQNSLQPAALDAIGRFLSSSSDLIRTPPGTKGIEQERVWAALIALGTFESELSFVLTDVQEAIRSRSERAFVHLQRSIVADPIMRERWISAFGEGEPECEKLGAVHLLLHGIFAFKVNAEGERTDLVFQEAIDDFSEKQRYADGMLLTEWKRTMEMSEAEKRFAEAREQAQLYVQSALAGTELADYRYAIVVSRDRIQQPADIDKDGIVYRHINIAVEPKTPSKVVK